jgi:hypothetical protein
MFIPMKVNSKVSVFLCLHDDINKNLLLPNVDTFNVFRNEVRDDVNMDKTLSMASVIDGAWIHYAQDRSRNVSSSKINIRSSATR